jgi:hypothetical protein
MFDLQVNLAGEFDWKSTWRRPVRRLRRRKLPRGRTTPDRQDSVQRIRAGANCSISTPGSVGEKGVRLLTPEARVLLYLTLSGPVTVTEAMQVAGTSYRGFYAVLERLKQAGLVAATRDANDQRVRRLQLDPSVTIPRVNQ